jgi:hypothetical protein
MAKKKVKKKPAAKTKTIKKRPTQSRKSARKKTRPAVRKAAKVKKERRGANRQSWLDAAAQTPMIDHYARELSTFIEAMADGRIEDSELKSQETRLVKLMKEIEPELSDELHAKVTKLLCEVTAYDIMHMLNAMAQSGPHRFQG